MSLHFHESPQWLQRHIKRWAKRLALQDWEITVRMADAEEMSDVLGRQDDTVEACTYCTPEYLSAQIWFSVDLDNTPEAEFVVVHELLHIIYWSLQKWFAHSWDGRRRLERDDAQRTLDALVEELIQRQCQQFRRLLKAKRL